MFKKRIDLFMVLWLYLVGFISTASAGPLAPATPLRINPGTGSGANIQCTQGSCIGLDVVPGLTTWLNLAPGTDGGIIVGKNQQAGEINTDANLGLTQTFFVTAPQPNSLCTGDAGANRYEDFGGVGSCSGSGCIGLTELKTWHMINAGICVPLGGGVVNSYQFDAVRGQWNLSYKAIIPSGMFAGYPFHMFLSGPTPVIGDPIPVVGDVSITMQQDTTAVWKPVVSILGNLPISCEIASPPQHGVATVASDCSQGTYQPAAGYVGADSFVYRAHGGIGSADGTVTASVISLPNNCSEQYPIVMLTTDGAGQSAAVNSTLKTTFTGNIVKSSASKLVICPLNRLEFQAQSSVGSAHCLVNGIFVGAKGFVKVRDRLVCSNMPLGGDIDVFRVIAQ